jgi:hypothetical protein
MQAIEHGESLFAAVAVNLGWHRHPKTCKCHKWGAGRRATCKNCFCHDHTFARISLRGRRKVTIQLCHQRSVIVVWSAWPSVKSVSGRGESFRLECHGTSAWNMRARTLSLRVQITRSVQPFCCDVYGQVSLRIMPLEERKEHKA